MYESGIYEPCTTPTGLKNKGHGELYFTEKQVILELKITKKHIFLKRLSLVQFIKKKKKKMGRWGSRLWALSSPAPKT